MLDGLAFLPVTGVPAGLQFLRSNVPNCPELPGLVEYFDTTYVTGSTRRIQRPQASEASLRSAMLWLLCAWVASRRPFRQTSGMSTMPRWHTATGPIMRARAGTTALVSLLIILIQAFGLRSSLCGSITQCPRRCSTHAVSCHRRVRRTTMQLQKRLHKANKLCCRRQHCYGFFLTRHWTIITVRLA